jgi:hypothetical protein
VNSSKSNSLLVRVDERLRSRDDDDCGVDLLELRIIRHRHLRSILI